MKRFSLLNGALASVAVVLVLFQAIMLAQVPLVTGQSDSAWYYMNLHYVLTGDYLFESFYPSFREPSQYYPFFGYSFFLYLCHQLAELTGISWSSIVKVSQFAMYLGTGLLLFRTALHHLTRSWVAYLLLLVYLSYYPYFNFTYLVMSETYGVFLLVCSVHCFLEYLRGRGAEWLYILLFMLTAGCSILVRPVFAPLFLVLLTIFAVTCIRRRSYPKLLFMVLFFVFPVSQAIFSKQHYGNYQLKSGFGWNLWNRAIHSDSLIPSSSKNLDELLRLGKIAGKEELVGTFWYDVTIHMSQLGYQERFIQDLCYRVARDGIMEHPAIYVSNTFKNSCKVFLEGMRVRGVKHQLADYSREFQELGRERHYRPLTELLARQMTRDGDSFANRTLVLNQGMSGFTALYNLLLHNLLVALLYLALPVLLLRKALQEKDGSKYLGNAIIWCAGVSVIFGSCLFEAPDDRYMLPAVVFIILSLAQAAELLLQKQGRDGAGL